MLTLLSCSACAPPTAVIGGPQLLGRAVLPAASFAAGPPSGAQLGTTPIQGQQPPFAAQPVQGFSALHEGGDGSLLALADNGYGALENSADFHLRVYTLRGELRTVGGGSGEIGVLGHIELRDPDHQVPFPIVQHFSATRILTGADFDVESMQRAADGTLWFGDEFGPFLLHTSADGVVLAPPYPLPDHAHPGLELRAPQNPYSEEGAALRVMHAVRWRAQQRGATRSPVFSPHHTMLLGGDGDDATRPGPTPAASAVFDPASLRRAGFPVIAWTVNDPARMQVLLRLGLDGLISDRPDLLLAALRGFDGDGDGRPDFITADGLIDAARFDAQGHRGARDLRPENTLPAMEAALDNLVTTLETDCGVTRDGVAILGHDPTFDPGRCRRGDGRSDTPALIRDLSRAEIQAVFVCDGLTRGSQQHNDRALSPVAASFAATEQLPDPYTPPTLAQLFRFVDAYAVHHETGPGAGHPEAALRARNARRVRFNVETKLNPRRDRDANGRVYAARTHGPEQFATSVLAAIQDAGLQHRVDVQSFDFRTLLHIQDHAPAVRTVFLFADFPVQDGVASGDGANLQGEGDAPSPWLAGLRWPYRVTARTQPLTVRTSGGFEGLALRVDPPALLPMLERPLLDAPAQELVIHEFDLVQKTYTDRRWTYPLDPRGVAVGEFVLDAAGHGLVIERDASEGDLGGYKAIHTIELGAPGPVQGKRLLVDLLAIADPHGLAPAAPGDVGVGGGRFGFPFATIEALLPRPDGRLLVLNDNNFPFGRGRHAGSRAPDDSELILVQPGDRPSAADPAAIVDAP